MVAVSDAESFEMTRRLAREEGLLVGGSCGMAVVAALRVAKDLPADAVVVVLLPDSGRGYLSKIFNDEWMQSYGFLRTNGGRTVGDVLHAKAGDLPGAGAHPSDRDPARRHRDPARVPRVADAGGQRRAAGDVRRGGRCRVRARPARGAVHRQGAPGRLGVGAHEPRPAARRRRRADRHGRHELEHSDAVLVIEDGKPVGVLTRADLLAFLTD